MLLKTLVYNFCITFLQNIHFSVLWSIYSLRYFFEIAHVKVNWLVYRSLNELSCVCYIILLHIIFFWFLFWYIWLYFGRGARSHLCVFGVEIKVRTLFYRWLYLLIVIWSCNISWEHINAFVKVNICQVRKINWDRFFLYSRNEKKSRITTYCNFHISYCFWR